MTETKALGSTGYNSNRGPYSGTNRSTGAKAGYRNFFGPGAFKYAIYPDNNWNAKKWGAPPLLGFVWADDEFYAEREAYTKNLLPVNFTFGVKAVKQRQQESN